MLWTPECAQTVIRVRPGYASPRQLLSCTGLRIDTSRESRADTRGPGRPVVNTQKETADSSGECVERERAPAHACGPGPGWVGGRRRAALTLTPSLRPQSLSTLVPVSPLSCRSAVCAVMPHATRASDSLWLCACRSVPRVPSRPVQLPRARPSAASLQASCRDSVDRCGDCDWGVVTCERTIPVPTTRTPAPGKRTRTNYRTEMAIAPIDAVPCKTASTKEQLATESDGRTLHPNRDHALYAHALSHHACLSISISASLAVVGECPCSIPGITPHLGDV